MIDRDKLSEVFKKNPKNDSLIATHPAPRIGRGKFNGPGEVSLSDDLFSPCEMEENMDQVLKESHEKDMGGERSTLTESQKEAIRGAANLHYYMDSPVPEETYSELGPYLLSFALIPGGARAKLAAIYQAGYDPVDMLCEDWEEAYSSGSLRLYNNGIDFPLRFLRTNGYPAEAAICRNNRAADGQNTSPWYVSFVPETYQLDLCGKVQPRFLLGNALTYEGDAVDSEGQEDVIPDQLCNVLLDFSLSDDYQKQPVNEGIKDELSQSEDFLDIAFVNKRWQEELTKLAGYEFNVLAFLRREWAFAFENDVLREYEGKISFPVSILRADGDTPVEVSIKRDGGLPYEEESRNRRPWYVCWVDSYQRNKVDPGKALEEWAVFNWSDMLNKLAQIALPEHWDFEPPSNGQAQAYGVLRNYLVYTFYRLKQEEKVLENPQEGIAAFNTGLVTKTYESIYACFVPAHADRKWRFAGFCKAGARGLGKNLVRAFNPLPARAQYFCRKEDLLYDASRELHADYDHILIDNVERLPLAFLEDALRGDAGACQAVQQFKVAENEERENALEELQAIS